jgi:hypothetical protein
MERRILAALALAGFVSCASARTYAERIEGIPYPADEADWKKKCRWLHWEAARQQNIASSGVTQPGTFSFETQAIARNNVATLDSRMNAFHCNAGYTSPTQPPSAKSAVESCVEACKAKSPRKPERCLDACSHR